MTRTAILSRLALALACVASIPAAAGCSSDTGSNDDPTVTVEESAVDTEQHTRVSHDHRWPGTRPASMPSSTPSATPSSAPSSAPSSVPSAPPASNPTATATSLRGVNLSGAEFGAALPGTLNSTYTWPTNNEVDYYFGKGLATYRIPFMWERLQQTAYGPLDAAYGASLDALIAHATSKGGHVILNPQNFARYYSDFVGSAKVPNAVFADFWSRVAKRYAGNPRVIFGLMNEPNGLPSTQWASAANAAITAIRATGATNTITVPGVDWTNAYSWYDSSYGTPNATALLAIHDPQNNVLFEVHNYLYANGAATDTCETATAGSTRLAGFLKWLRVNGKKGIVGEFAGGRNATCYAALRDLLTTMNASTDVLAGWLWWGGGPWWGDTYQFALDPSKGVDRPPMAILQAFVH